MDGTSSDDEVYDGVDLISDSDEDETTVENREERNIISSEEEIDTAGTLTRSNALRKLHVGDNGSTGGGHDSDKVASEGERHCPIRNVLM